MRLQAVSRCLTIFGGWIGCWFGTRVERRRLQLSAAGGIHVRVIMFCLAMVVCSACNSTSSDTNPPTICNAGGDMGGDASCVPTPIDSIAALNDMAQTPTTSFQVQLQTVRDVAVITTVPVSSPCMCAQGFICNCPVIPAPPAQVTSIAGSGWVSFENVSPYAEGLTIDVSFDPTIANGQTCLEMAQDALIHNLPFLIQGTATLIPIGWAAPDSGGGGYVPAKDPTTVSTLVSQATGVQDGLISPPIFSQPWVGVWLKSIDSCFEGTIPPWPPAPPPWAAVHEMQTCATLPCSTTDFGVTSGGFLNSSVDQEVSSDDLATLTNAATAVAQDIKNGNGTNCLSASDAAGVTDLVELDLTPPCEGETCPQSEEMSVVYVANGAQVCYGATQSLVNTLRNVMKGLETKYTIY